MKQDCEDYPVSPAATGEPRPCWMARLSDSCNVFASLQRSVQIQQASTPWAEKREQVQVAAEDLVKVDLDPDPRARVLAFLAEIDVLQSQDERGRRAVAVRGLRSKDR